MILGTALISVPATPGAGTAWQLPPGGHPGFRDDEMNSAQSMHLRIDEIEAPGTGEILRERTREKGRGVKTGLRGPRGGTCMEAEFSGKGRKFRTVRPRGEEEEERGRGRAHWSWLHPVRAVRGCGAVDPDCESIHGEGARERS